MGRTNASSNATVMPGYDPSITATATSTYIGTVTPGCIVPATVDATSAVGSPVRPTVSSSITTITGCSVTSEGTP